MNNEQKKQDIGLRMDSVRLTPEMIDEICLLQTSNFSKKATYVKADFNNFWLNDKLADITCVMDFIIMLAGIFDPDDGSIYLQHLNVLRDVKEHYEIFRVD